MYKGLFNMIECFFLIKGEDSDRDVRQGGIINNVFKESYIFFDEMVRDIIGLVFFNNKVNNFEQFVSNDLRSKFIIDVKKGDWMLIMNI